MIHRIYHFLLLAVWLNDSGGQLVPGRRHRRLAAKQLDLDLEIFVEKDKNEATKEVSILDSAVYLLYSLSRLVS